MIKIRHKKRNNYHIYFSVEARKIYSFTYFKFDLKNLSIRESSEFEKSRKISRCGGASICSSTDISGDYTIEKEDDVYYLTLQQ